jgi:diguanylate cyclase (GGDEF)-like protein/PAS domain S-box-containing protein
MNAETPPVDAGENSVQIAANEITIPRLHLVGTLLIVLLLTLTLSGFFFWQYAADHNAALQRISQSANERQKARYNAEMHSALSYIEFTRSRTEDILRQKLVEQVDVAVQVAEAIYARESPHRPAAQVKRLIVETLRPVRFFDGLGHIFINNMQGQDILQPMAPEREGSYDLDLRDDTGFHIANAILEAARKPRGEGFLRYRWHMPEHPGIMADRLAYLRHFSHYDWNIVTSDYLYKWERLQQKEAIARLRSVHFGTTGHIGLIDRDGRALLFPSDPDTEGKLIGEFPPQMRPAMAAIYKTARQGGGFVSYDWFNPGSNVPARKTALVRAAEPWGWIVVVTMFDEEKKAALDAEISQYEARSSQRWINLLIALAGSLSVGLLGSLVFSRWSNKLFQDYHQKIATQSDALRKLSQAVEQSTNAIVITDLNAQIEYVNAAFSHTTGYGCDEVIGRNPRFLSSGKTPHPTYADMWAHLSSGTSWQGELVNRRKDGTEYVEWVQISPVRQADGRLTHYMAINEDITERKHSAERIEHLANFDALTGLPNRAQLADRLQHAISLARRSNGLLALMFLDLDQFKDINDTLGHSIGDALLVELSQRLRRALREEDTVSRLGGDEFILLLPGLDARAAARVAQKLLDVIAPACRADQYVLAVTASVGIAMYPDDGVDLETLSQHADAAMYRAKQEGRRCYRFFTAEMQARSARHQQLVTALRSALERKQLEVYYQPQASLRDGRIIGAEALLRWQHDELGAVSPQEFIPVAEYSGLIMPIGEWVLRQAVRQTRAWIDQGLQPLIIAVNLSATQFRHADLPQLVTRILQEEGLAPEYLELELTEGVAMSDPQAAIAIMDQLHARGIRMALDDFGTGYSSLSQLKKFKVYMLKIDQSFVRDISTDPGDKAIVSAVIRMAASLGLQTIAEGVETARQMDFLREQGCDQVQGYHCSRPLTAEHFAAFLKEREAVPGPAPLAPAPKTQTGQAI